MRKRVAKKILQRPTDGDGFAKYTARQIVVAIRKKRVVAVLFSGLLLPPGWTWFGAIPQRARRRYTKAQWRQLLWFSQCLNGTNAIQAFTQT
jgi:hypothetical protein